MKVWRFNDYDWVAANSLEEGIEWYCVEYGVDQDEAIDKNVFRECSLEEVAWYPANNIPYAVNMNGQEIRVVDDEKCVRVPFANILSMENITSPCLIGSVEY